MSTHLELAKRVAGKEQYYTNPEVAAECVKLAMPFIGNKKVLEPSGGMGDFIEALKAEGVSDIVSYDIEPKHPMVQNKDFFEVNGLKKVFTIGNPPFGRNHSLSVKFFNHAAEMSDYIAFIIPKSWRKWSVQNRLDNRFHLVVDIEMDKTTFYNPDQEDFGSNLNTVFQIWEKRKDIREKVVIEDKGYVSKVPMEVADVALVYAGYGAGKVVEDFDRTKKNTTMIYLKANKKIIKVLKELDYSKATENCAYTPVFGFEELKHLLNEYHK